jgi:hypothetical protein
LGIVNYIPISIGTRKAFADRGFAVLGDILKDKISRLPNAEGGKSSDAIDNAGSTAGCHKIENI